MNLFGCKFCKIEDTINSGHIKRCERKNFDSLLWALVTVFQARNLLISLNLKDSRKKKLENEGIDSRLHFFVLNFLYYYLICFVLI